MGNKKLGRCNMAKFRFRFLTKATHICNMAKFRFRFFSTEVTHIPSLVFCLYWPTHSCQLSISDLSKVAVGRMGPIPYAVISIHTEIDGLDAPEYKNCQS